MLTMSDVQEAAITRLFETDATVIKGAMGAGKTVVGLTAAVELIEAGVLDKVIVLAPARVARDVWPNEADKWTHLKGKTAAKVTALVGPPAKRLSRFAETQIVALSIELVPWLIDSGILDRPGVKFGLVIDELTRFKSPGARCVKKLRIRLDRFRWRVGMTGTPVSDSWLSLYAMCLMIDGGRTFGTRFDAWRARYFDPQDYEQHSWALSPGADKQLAARIAPLFYELPDYRDTLPPLHIETVSVPLPADARAAYDEMARECMLGDVEAVNEAVLVGKLQQLANGFLYTNEARTVERYHTAKIDAAVSLLSSAPTVIVYWFGADRDALLERLPSARLGAEKGVLDDWNAGNVGTLLLHPRSAGHGVNLQAGGARMIWLGPQWSRDLHDQTIARIWRQGQTRPVRVSILAASDTVDEAVLARLKSKAAYERELSAHFAALNISS